MKVSELLNEQLLSDDKVSQELREASINVIGEIMANMPPVIWCTTTKTTDGDIKNIEWDLVNHSCDINEDKEIYYESKILEEYGRKRPSLTLYDDSFKQHEFLSMTKKPTGAVYFYIPGFTGEIEVYQYESNTGDSRIRMNGLVSDGWYSLSAAIDNGKVSEVTVVKNKRQWDTEGTIIGKVDTLSEATALISKDRIDNVLVANPENTMAGIAFRKALDTYNKEREQDQASM